MSKSTSRCVDDEAIALTRLKEQLRRRVDDRVLHRTVSNASGACEVIDQRCTEGIDSLILVSDWLMPGLERDELLAQVESAP